MLTKVKIYSIIIALVLFILGCEVTGGLNEETKEQNSTVTLELNKKYVVYKGDKIVPEDDDIIVEVEHIIGTDTKEIMVIEGKAQLVRGSLYYQQ